MVWQDPRSVRVEALGPSDVFHSAHLGVEVFLPNCHPGEEATPLSSTHVVVLQPPPVLLSCGLGVFIGVNSQDKQVQWID